MEKMEEIEGERGLKPPCAVATAQQKRMRGGFPSTEVDAQ